MKALKYISWGDNTGYAVAAKAYVNALIDAGVALNWTPMVAGPKGYRIYAGRDWPCAKLQQVCNLPLDYDTVLIHTVPEYYPEHIERERHAGRRVLGYTVWELARLPSHWPDILNQLDGVIVPCRWNVEVFRASGVTIPIHVVPHLSQFGERTRSSPSDRAALHARLGPEQNWRERFVFYNIGFWSHRKAPYLALEAYWKAFDANDPVVMIVKTTSRDITRWHRHWRDAFRLRHPSPHTTVAALATHYPRAAPVIVIADEGLSDGEILALHETGDCFVSLTRTEGWGLGAFEAARLGKPVVMTGYGGQSDFLDPALSWRVDYDMVAVHEPTWSSSYRPEDSWAEPSTAHAATHLRSIFDHADEARVRAHRLGTNIREKFSCENTVKSLLSALSEAPTA